ncbi:MAG: ribosome maturation factor RimP [Bdellovibrionaceae bacterium]|nr:ribosome maturation factor RimP [Pseudobdellovibrionaceae bacterium]MBX3033436.1 ribosome maturation factor RimP [Pseudobdellovibrionaceae bacterium]
MRKVENLAADVCRREGCFLYDIEFTGLGKGRTLRVFVDRDAEGGSSIDDCSNVSKGLNEILDADDVIPGGPYNLEVSTPGIDRVLKQPWHFEKAVGKKIWVKVRAPLESLGVTDKKWKNAKQVESTLSAADGEAITFDEKEGPIRIPFSAIEKAKMVFEMQQKGQKKK